MARVNQEAVTTFGEVLRPANLNSFQSRISSSDNR